jgi:hypothetical protein
MDDFTQADAVHRITEEAPLIDGVRKRPGMYVGSTEFFGFINYLVCPVSLLLGQRPTRLAIDAGKGGFEVEADVALPIEELSCGRFAPFEEILDLGHGHSFEGTVLNALSETLKVEVRQKHRTDTLAFCRGTRESHRASTNYSDSSHTTLKFVEGGTQEMGLNDALDRLHQRFALTRSRTPDRNGVVAVVSI